MNRTLNENVDPFFALSLVLVEIKKIERLSKCLEGRFKNIFNKKTVLISIRQFNEEF
jgi:hypothetical protein